MQKFVTVADSILLQLNTELYIANAGDSRTLVATYCPSTRSTSLIYASREDKPHLPEERERVERMGGRVRLPQPAGSGGTSRLMYVDRKSGREYGLAMSRSIGDWDAGKVGLCRIQLWMFWI